LALVEPSVLELESPFGQPFEIQPLEQREDCDAGATTITYTAAIRGQAHWPIPPDAEVSTTGIVRTIWSRLQLK
jgi:hypothetical protein